MKNKIENFVYNGKSYPIDESMSSEDITKLISERCETEEKEEEKLSTNAAYYLAIAMLLVTMGLITLLAVIF